MSFITLYFVLLSAGGGIYLAPMEVRNPPCGVHGEIVGLQINRATNPTTAYWPDPYFPGAHCVVDIKEKIATLVPGTYELATTEMGDGSGVPYIGIDPHISPRFVVGERTMLPPATLGISGSGQSLPATRMLSWDANTEPDLAGYVATQDGVAFPPTTNTQLPITLASYKSYDFTVRAFNVAAEMSEPAAVTYTLVQPAPSCATTIRVDDWSREVPIGGRGTVRVTLIASVPIVQLQVKLGGQVIGEVNGADLRDLAGLYFSVPRTPGAYNINVAVRDSSGCSTQTTATRTVNVQ